MDMFGLVFFYLCKYMSVCVCAHSHSSIAIYALEWASSWSIYRSVIIFIRPNRSELKRLKQTTLRISWNGFDRAPNWSEPIHRYLGVICCVFVCSLSSSSSSASPNRLMRRTNISSSNNSEKQNTDYRRICVFLQWNGCLSSDVIYIGKVVNHIIRSHFLFSSSIRKQNEPNRNEWIANELNERHSEEIERKCSRIMLYSQVQL